MSSFVVPPPVEPGDDVAIGAPSSGLAQAYPHVYERGLDRLESVFDLHPVEYPTATADGEHLYDHPEERARDVEDAFSDPDVSAVVATIGGNDQIRMLRHLDVDVLREHPTRFFGYSDNTNLALALWNAGVVSYYGGMVLTEFAMPGSMDDHTVEYLRRAFFDDNIGSVDPPGRFTDEDLDWADPANLDRDPEWEPSAGRRWENGEGTVTGRVWGGCLEILDVQFLAGRYLPDPAALDGTVLAVETSEELPDAETVRGWLVGLGERGILSRFDGVMVGRAKARSHRRDRDPESRSAYREAQRDVVSDVFAEYNPDAPVVFDVSFGHTQPTTPLPVGGRVELDPENDRIAFVGD